MEKRTHDSSMVPQQAVIRNIWLNYYNNILLKKKIITKDEHRKMQLKINTKYPLAK